MSNYDNTNTGALFRNDKEGNEKRPDYRGQLDVEGVEYWVSAWIKTSKKGDKYMSLSIQPKEDREDAKPAPKKQADEAPFDDDIPF